MVLLAEAAAAAGLRATHTWMVGTVSVLEKAKEGKKTAFIRAVQENTATCSGFSVFGAT